MQPRGLGVGKHRRGPIGGFAQEGQRLIRIASTVVVLRQSGDEIGQSVGVQLANDLGGAGVYTVLAAWTGLDTLAVPLFLLLSVSVLSLPAHRRLFASSFVLTLTLELYGTALGNWYWHRDVPWVGLVTTNPPAIAGAFYCTLHALAIAVKSTLKIPRLAPQ